MRIKILASANQHTPTAGPYKMQDIVERESLYGIGDPTHYGAVVLIPPPLPPFADDVDQSVIVQLDPTSVGAWCGESVFEKPPSSYNKIQIFPILAATIGRLSDDPPLTGTHAVWQEKNLTIENVSHLITPGTFSLWKKDCFISKTTASALDNVKYAIVHRYSSPMEREPGLDKISTDLINFAVACLALIRPTRRSRARNIPGVIRPDGTFDAHGFSTTHEPVEVPEIQKLFTVREKDIELLRAVLPEFVHLYQYDEDGKMKDDYEPLRMAVQLYEQAYSLSAWKARHILWWSAIEALYGDGDDITSARIYALFGNKKLIDGYNCTIYEKGDIPSCYNPQPGSIHKLGKMVPVIYEVRNASAHGQKVPDSHFSTVAHPFGQTVGIDALAEAETFIIRKTVIEILKRGWRDRFKDRAAREHFWLMEFSLPKNQCKKRMKELKASLEGGHS
jgi:hypothetical protein